MRRKEGARESRRERSCECLGVGLEDMDGRGCELAFVRQVVGLDAAGIGGRKAGNILVLDLELKKGKNDSKASTEQETA